MLSLMFYYILTFSVICYYTDPRQHGIFFVFFNDKKCKSLLMVTLSVRIFSNIFEVGTIKMYNDCIRDLSLSRGTHLSESHA